MKIEKILVTSFILIAIVLLSEVTTQASFKTYRTFPTTDVTKYAGITPEELVEMEGDPDEIIDDGSITYAYFGDSNEDIGDPENYYDSTTKNESNHRIDLNNDDAAAYFTFDDGKCVSFEYIESDFYMAEIGSVEDKLEFLSDFGVIPGPDIIDCYEDIPEDETKRRMMLFQNVNDEIVQISFISGMFSVIYEWCDSYPEPEDISASDSKEESDGDVDQDELSEENLEDDTDSHSVNDGVVTVEGTGEEVQIELEYGIYSVTTTADECDVYYDDIDSTGQFTVSSSEPSKVCTGGEGSTVLVTLPEGETATFTPTTE